MTHDNVRRAVSRPFVLLVTDKDDSLTIANQKIALDTVEVLDQFIAATQKQEPMPPHVAVISGMMVRDIHKQVTYRLPTSVRRRFHAMGSGGTEYSPPPHDPIIGPAYSKTWKDDFLKTDYVLLLKAIRDSLDELRDELQKLGIDGKAIAIQERKSKITIEVVADSTLNSRADLLRQKIAEKIRKKQGVNSHLTTVTASSVAIDISLADKKQALHMLVDKLRIRKSGVSAKDMIRRTICFGDSRNDLPMLNEVAHNKGVSIWLGEPNPAILHKKTLVLPLGLRGPKGFTYVMQHHLDWLERHKRGATNGKH